MIKRTPQEIADFFGCYVVQSREDGDWYVMLHKPIRHENGWAYAFDTDVMVINEQLISVPANHDWTHLYEPQKKDPIEVFKDIQSRRNINAESDPHASQVYIGPEYKMLCGDEAGDGGYIGDLVNGYLAKGWRLYGAPFYGNGFIWQAMVRGV